ncbi:NAD(P)H-binding protein [Enterococcus sp. BWM-S5]|uniref:NAD(P)H-binding protein n=1 Tax=Enterococcus larvae TaxID=2794352 RepID=A0ABS4CPR5_9ENTE|nr:NAD(P)H-binding protein [Enterococcus larvae]MBP1047992.1 NAD(P)H-binding protein [Enterococcus larvae]
MRIAVLGGNGKAGSLIIKELIRRNLDVTAIVRSKNKLEEKVPTIEKDIYSLSANDIKDFDVLVCALGFRDHVEEFSSSMEHLLTILAGLSVRLVVVGGAGSLYIDAEQTIELKDSPDFPKEYKAVPTAMSESLQLLKHSSGVTWTYVSPAETFDAHGERTGHYQLAGEVLTRNAAGKSYISYADYAIALADEIEHAAHLNQRISVYS